MIRNLKVLGLAVMAVFAMTAVAASAASADEFHSESAPATFAGSQTVAHVFTTAAGTVKCSTATFSGESNVTTSSTQTLAATYGGCKAFGFVNVPVTMHSCKYVFHLGAGTVATTDIACENGESIEVDAPFGCTISVPAQTGLSEVTLSNTGTGTSRDIDAVINVANIDYNVPSGCALASAGTHTDGTYTGSATIQGSGQGIWVN